VRYSIAMMIWRVKLIGEKWQKVVIGSKWAEIRGIRIITEVEVVGKANRRRLYRKQSGDVVVWWG